MAYFVMYENQKTKERCGFESIATHKAIENIVKGYKIGEDKEGFDKIILSPGDLVYVPTKEERECSELIDWKNIKTLLKRIYKIVSFSGKDLLCVKADISDPIIPTNIKEKVKGEIDWHNKSTSTMEGDVTIKNVCIKLNIDRLGNIKPYNNSIKLKTNRANVVNEPATPYFSKASISTLQQADEQMLLHTSKMNPEERMAYLQQLRETTQNSNLSEEEKISILSKFKINPSDENS